MNKKTGEFSAADLKKPIGKKEESTLGPGESRSSAVPGYFVCL